MLDDRKSTEGSSLGPLKNENTALFSLHADPSCTMRLGGRLGKVWDSPDDLGRVYGCGKTDQHTKSIEGVTFGANIDLNPLLLNESCTMRLGGQLGKVCVCPDGPGRSYGRG